MSNSRQSRGMWMLLTCGAGRLPCTPARDAQHAAPLQRAQPGSDIGQRNIGKCCVHAQHPKGCPPNRLKAHGVCGYLKALPSAHQSRPFIACASRKPGRRGPASQHRLGRILPAMSLEALALLRHIQPTAQPAKDALPVGALRRILWQGRKRMLDGRSDLVRILDTQPGHHELPEAVAGCCRRLGGPCSRTFMN